MVKVRMNTADVAAQVKCLRGLIGMRCANVYDLSPKTYIFKLMKSSGVTESGESEKVLLLLESGIRLHTTGFARDKSSTPSGFTLKLRKHIRTKRLEEVRQLGIDRVVDFQFGLGEGACHIILELYAQGNLLLTDAGFNVLTLLRTHRDEEKGLTMMAHHKYPVDSCRLWERTSFKKLETALTISNASEINPLKGESAAERDNTVLVADLKFEMVAKGKDNQTHIISGKKGGSGARNSRASLKNIVGESLGYGPALSEHIILDAGLPTNLQTFTQDEKGQFLFSISKVQMEQLYAAVTTFENWLEDIISGNRLPEGYILMQKRGGGKRQNVSCENEQLKVYEEFSPLMLNQYRNVEAVKMSTFDAAMDEFFSKIEGQRAEQQRKTQEDSAFQKLEKIRNDQASRVEALKKEVDQSVAMAELIEYNLEDVDAAILAVCTALATGMDWNDLARMIKDERKAGNPVASIIHSLQLEKNHITLLLSNNLDNMDEDEKTQPATKVEVDLSLSAHANARRWFEMKKKHFAKQEKTIAAHAKAFKAAEKKTQQQLAQEKTVAAISHIRKVHWFEKFDWFISSENYLVISGRDAQQNELVVKRYLKKGDLYVHADLHGASSTVIKNCDPNCAVPPLTLNQAGSFTVCRSQAWDSKIVTSAWWVYAHQVSKTAPTGEYLTVGSFMIRGRKNFLPPHPLVMGFGILFRLDESCIAAHLKERKVRIDEDDDFVKYHSVREDHSMDEAASFKTLEMPWEGMDEVSGISSLITKSSVQSTEAASEGRADTEDRPQAYANMSVAQNSVAFEELMDKALELSADIHLDKASRKYGVDAYPSAASTETIDEDDNEDMVAAKLVPRGHPYLSKAERRKMKKGSTEDSGGEKVTNRTVETVNVADSDIDKQAETIKAGELDQEACTGDETTLGIPTAGKMARGRKSKLKKIKEKYSEQDEEERKLRMALLASAGRHVVNLTSKKSQSAMEQQSRFDVSELVKDTGTKICYKCKKLGHVARDCPIALHDPKDPELEHSVDMNAADLEKIAIMHEENIIELGDNEKDKLTELDSLTGKPVADDILLYAVPVCGPYNALHGYKYRVKLTPGSSKRGKAAKTALNVFIHMQEATSREKELMKAITDPELVAAIIGNVKVTAPGLTQLKQQQKKGKKTSTNEN